MNDYEISKLKKELQRKHQLLKEEQLDRQQTEQQLVQVSAERDKYHTELLIARKQIENIDKIIAENVKTMKAKLEEENFNSLNELKDLKEKLKGEQFLNEKLVEENRNKDATIAELSARLREMSKKYKDPSLLVNTKQISEQVMITHNQFYKLTEKYNKLSKDMENIMAENKILRKLHGVPDNFGFDLEEIKIAEKQQLEDYKAQCRKLQNQIEELEAERTQLRYRLRQYNTLYSNKGERYKDMTQQQLELLDLYAMNLKEGKFDLPQIDKSQKQMEREILKLRAQVEVLQNKAPMSIMQMNNQSSGNTQKVSNDQMKKMQEQIKAYLQPFMQDMKKINESNLNGLVQNLQNLQNLQNMQNLNNEAGMNIQGGNFKGPIPLPVAYNDWSKIKEGYSFLYSSKIPVDLKDLEGDVSFDVVRAKYQIAALQLQNIESLKLLKEKQKVQNNLSRQIFELKEKYKKCLKVQDQLFLRYFNDKEKVNQKIQRLEVDKHQLSNEKKQLEAKLEIVQGALQQISQKGDLERKLRDSSTRLAIAQAEVLKLQRKYQVLDEESKTLKETYTKLQTKLNETERSLREKLTTAKNNERELTVLVNRILDDVKDSVSSEVHNLLLEKMQLMNDKASHMISKETQLRLRLQKLEGLERESNEKNKLVENLREDNLQIWLELQIVKNRLKTVDSSYRAYTEILERFIKFLNENNTSLMNLFKKFDRDNSGNVSKKEFGDALKNLNFSMTPSELDLLFMEFDVDGSEQITYKEFIKKMRRAGAMSRTKEEDAVLRLFKAIKQSNVSIKRAFQIIDQDNSKEVTKAEMQRAFSQIGITTTAQTVNYLFKMCDNNNDDKITQDELQRLYKEMVRDSNEVEDEIYGEDMDWKLAFVLKLEEVSLRFNSTLSETFKKLDDDGNSVLTMTELVEFLKKSEMQIDSSALKELFDFLDRRKDGKVEYGEFLKVLAEAKNEKLRIERIKYVKERTKQLKAESQKIISSQSNIASQSMITQSGELQKMKIRLQALGTKQTNLLKRNQQIVVLLAKNEQRVKQLERSLEMERKEKQSHLDKYHEERLAKITMQTIADKGKSDEVLSPLKKQLNELKIRNTEISNDLQLYKNLYEGLTDKNKGEELKLGKLEAECKKYYDIVKELQSTSQTNAQLGKLYIQLEYSKRNEEIVNSKYDKIVDQLRKVDGETKKLAMISAQKQKEIINTHLFFSQKCKLQQSKIDDYALKIIPAITMDKMQDYLIKLRAISNSKSSLQDDNLKLRETNYNLQARNDYVQNEKIHITELERKLRSQYSDDNSKAIIDLTKRLSDYKMSELKAKRELSLLKEKEEYYLRVHNTHNDNIKELEEELSNWQVKYNEREEFWRKRLSDQIKLMEEFQREANKAKQQQITTMNYFNQKRDEQEQVNRKYQELNPGNFNNISQFIRPQAPQSFGNQQHSGNDDEYTEQLLDKIAKLEQQLNEKEKELYHFRTAVKDIMPETNINKLMDFGGQMNVSTNSFVMQTELTSSQLKSNARRFLNGQKQIETYYKEENARITQAAQQSIETLQRIIDDKNEQLRKKERMIQDLKKQFNDTIEKDCVEIQKLHEEIRDLRSKSELNNINELMSRTTKNNFFPSSKAETKLEEYQQLVNSKDMEIRSLQDKYDKLLITKTTAQNQKTAAKNTVNAEKLKQKLEELTFERENEKKKFQQKEKQFEKQILSLKKVVNQKTKKIEQLNNALKDIKEDIINEKNSLTEVQTEQNLKTFVQNMSKGTNKNDAVMEQYMQSALVKIKNLQGQNRDLKEELSRAKDVASKTATRFGR